MAEKSEKVSVNASPAPSHNEEEAYAPLVDIREESDGTVVIDADVPGATAENVDIRVEKGVLTLYADGRIDEPGEDYSRTYSGFAGAEYFRAFALSDEIDRDRIESSLRDGVLTIRLPRAAAAQTRKIEIKTD